MGVAAVSNRGAEFRQALADRILVADGAMGTALYAKGVFLNRCYDELNLSLPSMIRDVHQEYVRAGAEIIETNTFGANRKRLAAFGFTEKLRQINQAGVRIAKEAARDQAFVAGAVGPLGVRLEPLGPVSFAEARELFREQVEALVEAGVDALFSKRFAISTNCARRCWRCAKLRDDELPLIAQIAIEDDGNLQDGTSTEDFTRALDQWPVDVIGLNCSSGPRVLLEAIEKMALHTEQAAERDAERGLAGDGGRPQSVFVLARIHGAVLRGGFSRPAPRSWAAAAAPRPSTSRKSATKHAASSPAASRSRCEFGAGGTQRKP